MTINFHEGEVQLQAESGVDTAAFDAMLTQPFQPALSPVEVRFVGGRTFVVAASVDANGRPWASPLFGSAGELVAVQDPVNLQVTTTPAPGDPLIENIGATGELGLLFFDPSLRRRSKSLGKARVESDGTMSYQMTRSFGICNKYIYKRSHDMGAAASDRPDPRVASTLDEADIVHLQAADTTFLASFYPKHGADPTHRGGPAGFVTVIDDRTISMPDYMGNGMFQTLGNLLLDDRVGFATTDFATGRTVQLTGRGKIVESPEDDDMSFRTLVISIDEVRVTWPHVGQWTDIEAFDARPGMVNPGTPYIDGRPRRP